MRSFPRSAAALAALVLGASPLLAQKGTETGAYVVRLGADTIAVEKYTRTANRLEVDAVVRTPTTTKRHYVATLKGGDVTQLDYAAERLDKSVPPTKAKITYGADTTIASYAQGDSNRVVRTAARQALPYVGNAFALMDLMIARFLAMKTDSATITSMAIGAPQPSSWPMSKESATVVRVWYFGDPMMATLDASGHLVSLDGSRTTNKIMVERVKDANIPLLTTTYQLRDAQGKGLGQLSPADSVRATVGPAQIAINYSSPGRRGRTLLGAMIPYDQVWRTGANAATTLTTTVDLDFGGTVVPAGKYSLWTLPTRTGWTLIINKQSGQWGTEYDPAQDLARIPLQVVSADQQPEHFVIDVEPPTGTSSRLVFAWGDIALAAPFKVKQ